MSLGTILYLLTSCNTPSPSISPTPTPKATEQLATTTVFAQVTADPLFNLVGSYTGTYQWQGSSFSSPVRLEVTQQDGISLTGECLLSQQSFPLLHTVTSPVFGGEEGVITFTLDIPGSQGQQAISLNFHGEVTKEETMTGEVIASDRNQSTWSMQKAPGRSVAKQDRGH